MAKKLTPFINLASSRNKNYTSNFKIFFPMLDAQCYN